MRFKRLSLALITSLCSFHASATDQNTFQLPQMLKNAEAQGYLEIIKTAPVVELPGKTAVMVRAKKDSEMHVYWVDNKSKALSTGDLVLDSGVNLTSKYSSSLKPSLNSAFHEVFDDGLILSNGKEIDISSTSTLYVFYEPFCGYCHKLHAELQPLIAQGLDVKIIPVSFLRAESPDVIATLAASPDLKLALAQSDKNQLPITVKADSALRAKINKNINVMNSLGVRGTPAIVYKDKDGKVTVTSVSSGPMIQHLAKELMQRSI